MNVQIGTACDPGKKRSGINQDSIGVYRPLMRPPMLVLADGMGGYTGGAMASKLVVRSFIHSYRFSWFNKDYAAILQKSAAYAHRAIRKRGLKKSEFRSMGSTVAAVILDEQRLYTINVGDSRVYLHRQNSLTQLSYDHSLVADMARSGAISPDQIHTHRRRNQLTMSISAKRDRINTYTYSTDLESEDIVLLCSDGLWALVHDHQIQYYLENFPPEIAAADLLKEALFAGGSDNISIIIAKVDA